MAFLPPPCFKFTWQHLHRTGGFHKVPTAEISQELQMFCTLRIRDGKSLDLKNGREGILRGLVSVQIYFHLFLQDLKYSHEKKRLWTTEHSLQILHFVFWVSLPLAWNLPSKLGWLVGKPQGFTCLQVIGLQVHTTMINISFRSSF